MLGDFEAYYRALENVEIRRGQSLRDYTSFHIGGPADLLLPTSQSEILHCLRTAMRMDVPLQVIGNGTNLLVSDAGVAEPVLCLRSGVSAIQNLGNGVFKAEAGALLSTLANEALRQGYTGLEWAAGIPGSVGGAAAMNAGAYGGQLSDVLQAVCSISAGDLVEQAVRKDEMGYRKSPFKAPARTVASITVALPSDDGCAKERMQTYAKRRAEKQPLCYPSAGSVFKRPLGHYAGALIEEAGLKGVHIGDAAVSELHAGFIINRGTARCEDVLQLIELVQKRVLATSGIALEPEIRIIGIF